MHATSMEFFSYFFSSLTKWTPNLSCTNMGHGFVYMVFQYMLGMKKKIKINVSGHGRFLKANSGTLENIIGVWYVELRMVEQP